MQELKKEIKQYIHYYNHHRIKSSLNGKSPVQYRASLLNLKLSLTVQLLGLGHFVR